MTENIFLEILFVSNDFPFDGRDEIEDPLDESLQEANVGEVIGGGSGMGKINIDVEVNNLNDGLKIIRDVLTKLSVPSSTIINQNDLKKIHKVYLNGKKDLSY